MFLETRVDGVKGKKVKIKDLRRAQIPNDIMSKVDIRKEYTVLSVDICGYHTEVFLEEFPRIPFNSVCFDIEFDKLIN